MSLPNYISPLLLFAPHLRCIPKSLEDLSLGAYSRLKFPSVVAVTFFSFLITITIFFLLLHLPFLFLQSFPQANSKQFSVRVLFVTLQVTAHPWAGKCVLQNSCYL